VSRILLLTSGTRGDVQPFVALARGLRRAGHDVSLCTHERFRGFVEEHGVRYAFMNDDLLRLADTPEGRALTEGRGNPIAALRTVGPIFARMLREAQAAAAGVDLIVHHPKSLAAPSLSEAYEVPAVMALPVPSMTPTRAFALPLLGDRDLGGPLNRLSYAPLSLQTSAFRGVLDAWRSELGLPRARLRPPHVDALGRPVPTLYPVSPRLVTRPVDWPETTVLTGAWFLDDMAAPSADLAAFLADGPAPVTIGFGSMVGSDPAGRAAMVLEAVERAEVRAVLVAGWGGLDPSAIPDRLRDRVHVVPSAPFAWLFPRSAAVVHHGGAGTTAEGLRAGVPSLICPFFGDQPYWGGRVARLGVGPRPIPQRRLTGSRLASAFRSMLDDRAMRDRAAALGREVAAEDGVGEAVRRLEAWLGGARRPVRS
jgi:sterol 3beta-glucosyltransferase